MCCRNDGLTCSISWLEKLGNEEMSHALDINNQLRKCWPRCRRQTLTPTFTVSKFPLKASFTYHRDFCLTLFKVARICSNPIRANVFEAASEHSGTTCQEILNANNSLKLCTDNVMPNVSAYNSNPKLTEFLYKYANNNFLALRVFIRDPYYTSIKTDEQMSLLSFLGNAGGLVGLYCGLSVVSIFEMCYHSIIFLTDTYLRKYFSK
jgi:hypothetical protein